MPRINNKRQVKYIRNKKISKLCTETEGKENNTNNMIKTMKMTVVATTSLLLSMAPLAEESTSDTGALEIKVTNIENIGGTLHLSLQNSAEGWLSTDPDVVTFRDVSSTSIL